MTTKGKARILGPYADRDKWRIVSVDAGGNRESVVFETEAKATRYKELLLADLDTSEHTTETAFELYKAHLREKGDKERSIETTEGAIASFFPEPLLLRTLSAKRCASLYDELRARPMKRTGKPPSVDTHRNALAQAKSFLAWCASHAWISGNPLETVKGIGKRRRRGLSLGKAGNELRVKEARIWYRTALAHANRGDHGATAALVALLLGMRASEIVSRKVGDLDTDEAEGDLLWIPCSKTAAGRRTLEVPKELRAPLVAAAANKTADRHLFEASRPHERELHKPHERGWVKAQVHRICGLAKVPEVTAHAMRGLLATITAERGLAGHLIAATLGHEDERTTMTAYAAPGSASTGINRRGLDMLNSGTATELAN